MSEIAKQLLREPLTLWRNVKTKAYIFGDYIYALCQFWLGSRGFRASHQHRLMPLSSKINISRQDEGASQLYSKNAPARIAIFIAFAKRLTRSNKAYIEALNQAGFAVVYINNKCTEQASALAIKEICWRAYDRYNIGRDFGGFRDGVMLLRKEGLLESCQLLCIANDSMQFIPGRNAKALVIALNKFANSKKQALFSHISHQIQTHYQSYFQVLKPEIFRSKAFLGFWENYRFLSHRRHCIHKGEIMLSQSVYRRFSDVDILYTSDKLQEEFLIHYDTKEGIPAEEVLRLMPSPARTSQRCKVGYSLQQLLQSSENHGKLTGSQIYSVADLIENGNPSHVAAFLYPKYLRCPFIKHDLCTAGSYTIAQAVSLYKEVLLQSLEIDNLAEAEEIVNEYRDSIYIRGVPLSYQNRSREAAIAGVTGSFIYPSTY